jgi:hypothetical protein
LIWWVVTGIVFSAVFNAMGLISSNGRPRSIWVFVVIPLGAVALFPIAYALDRILTPRLRQTWRAWQISRQERSGR